MKNAYGAKHLQLRWRVNGCEYSIPCTPSDVRAPNNVRADVRRLLRQDGVLTMLESNAPPSKPPDRITIFGASMRGIGAMMRRIGIWPSDNL